MNKRKENLNMTHTNPKDEHVSNTNIMVTDQVTANTMAENVVELLNTKAENLSFQQQERLANARNLAVKRLSELQTQASTQSNHNGHILTLIGDRIGQHRFASLSLVILAVLLSALTIEHLYFNAHLENSDAYLLASDLPPEAYADKGFDAWLDAN